MNGTKVVGGYGSLIISVVLFFSEKFGIPITPDVADGLASVLTFLGGLLLHKADAPKR